MGLMTAKARTASPLQQSSSCGYDMIERPAGRLIGLASRHLHPKANLSRLPQRRLDADVACGRPAEAGHAADVACGRAGVRTWRAAARAGAQAVEVSLRPRSF